MHSDPEIRPLDRPGTNCEPAMSHTPTPSPLSGPAGNLSPLVGQIRPSHAPPATRFTSFSPPTERVSLAHDYLLVMRGAERTFAAMAELYAQAPIFTLLYDEQGTDRRFAGREITTSPLQRLGVGQSNFRRLLPLYPAAAGRLRPPSCDVVISSSSAFAHGLRAPEGAVHICYCYTPFRYAWDEQEFALGEVPAALRPLLRSQLRSIRKWDLAASRRVDAYIAISELGRERIKRCYGRDAAIVHPPVETHRFLPGTPGDSLLIVSELVRHKRVHVALEAPVAHACRSVWSAADPTTPRCRRPTPRPSSSGAPATTIWSSCTRPHARCSCRAWRSLASPWSRRRQPDAR